MFDGWCIRPPKNNTSTLIELRSTQSIIDGQGMGWSGSHDDVCMCVQQTSGQHWNKKQKVLPGSVRFFSFQHFYLSTWKFHFDCPYTHYLISPLICSFVFVTHITCCYRFASFVFV
jgi:hypothetical protein